MSTILVLPLLILEWMNRAKFSEDFPFVLFAVLWVLPFSFILLLPAIVRSGPPRGTAAYGLRLLNGAVLVCIAWWWISLVIDQMPCFLGVPNCD